MTGQSHLRNAVLVVAVTACAGGKKQEPAPVPASPEPADASVTAAEAVAPVLPDGAVSMTDAERHLAAETAAYANAKPVFEEHCKHCHTTAAGDSKAIRKALKHFNMDAYPFTGHHAHELGAIVRKVLGVGGSKISMPKDDEGAVSGQQLELVVAWSKAFDAVHAAGEGHHAQPGTGHHGKGHKGHHGKGDKGRHGKGHKGRGGKAHH